MTPEQALGTAQFIADQQGQFATGLLRMQNTLEQIANALRRLEAQAEKLAAGLDQLGGDSRRQEAALRESVTVQAGLRQQIDAVKAAVENLRLAA